MFWTEKKLSARIQELEAYRYRDVYKIDKFTAQEDEEGAPGTRPPVDAGGFAIRNGEHWAGRDRYIWLSASAEIPEAWKGRSILGIFDFGITGGGNNSGFESLLYVNGEPYQGVDANHQEVFLDDRHAASRITLQFRLWSGLEGGGKPTAQEHQIKRAELGWLDEEADDFFYTSKAVLETVEVLGEAQTERTRLLTALDRAFLQVDWSEPGTEGFYASIRAARTVLRKELDAIASLHPVTVHAIGHTHIDVAWLWRLKHTREKTARSFSTVLRLMEKFPEYVFLQTQPQLYDYIKQDYPEIFAKIRERVADGRWEAGGAMWLEADCNLTSGESLVRQILMGTRFFRDEFGAACKYLWLPDVFGYSWALPQILKKSGIDAFMTTKISWNQYNRMPHDTFMWRGIDGSEIMTHFISVPEDHEFVHWQYTYNAKITPQTINNIWKVYQDKAINQDLLISYGFGDGGGGVNREMLEMRRRLEHMPGLPSVVAGRADAYFDKLLDNVEKTDQYVHTWDGELYLEYHRGTYTSQAYNKRMNRKLELLFRDTEWLNVLRAVSGRDWSLYPRRQLNEGWKILLRNQFHDIIPGSSIREVYEDSKAEYAQAHELVSGEWDAAANALLARQDSDTYTVFNSAAWKRSDAALIPVDGKPREGKWMRGEQILTAQQTEAGWLVQIPDMPPAGMTTVTFQPSQHQTTDHPFIVRENGVETPHYVLAWNASGQLIRIFDKSAGREVLAEHTAGNVLQIFEDKPMNFEAWDIDIYYQEKKKEVGNLKSCKVAEIGPLRAVVRFEWTYNKSLIVQNMVLYRDSKRIDFQTTVNWHERQQLLKTAFPVDVRATYATYDIQFGNVRRPTHWNTSWDQAKFETVGHQWADLSERGFGVSLLNDCKYGYDIKDNVMRLSLIKSAIHPDTGADQGQHEFTYSLYPHNGDFMEGGTVREAWHLNNPVRVAAGTSDLSGRALFDLSAGHVQIDAVKKAEDRPAVILRVHEWGGQRGDVKIRSDFQLVSWQECDLMENAIGEKRSGQPAFPIKPYEIKTFIIEIYA